MLNPLPILTVFCCSIRMSGLSAMCNRAEPSKGDAQLATKFEVNKSITRSVLRKSALQIGLIEWLSESLFFLLSSCLPFFTGKFSVVFCYRCFFMLVFSGRVFVSVASSTFYSIKYLQIRYQLHEAKTAARPNNRDPNFSCAFLHAVRSPTLVYFS